MSATPRQIEVNQAYRSLGYSVNATSKHFSMSRSGTIKSLFGGASNGLVIDKTRQGHRVMGVFSCLHEPACKPGYFEFVRDTFAQFGVTDVMNLGDLIDHHFISRHVSEPDALNPIDEMDLAVENLKKWSKEFPDVYWCEGNHDAIPRRQVKTLGIPAKYLKSLNEIYELPKTWEMRDHWEIDKVWYEHGLGSNGMYGAKNSAMRYRMNYVQGHTHAHAGVHHMYSPKDHIFGLNVGCGMDEDSYAARYGKRFKDRVCLGCGIVIDGKIPFFVPMEAQAPVETD